MPNEPPDPLRVQLRRIGAALQILSLLAAVAMTLYASYHIVGRVDPALEEWQKTIDRFEESVISHQQSVKQFSDILELLEAAETEELSEAIILERYSSFEGRLAAIEKILDVQPREILDLIRLRDEMEGLKKEVGAAQLQMIREVDRAYNMVLMVTVGLLISVVTMVIGNFLRKR